MSPTSPSLPSDTTNNAISDGVFTGPVVLARTFHHHVTTPAVPTPRQLPPPARHFTDREEDRSVLDDARTAGCRLIVISGIGGVGKTALATQWLTDAAYNDGQVYVDLSGPEGAMLAESVLRRWLRAFGLGRPPTGLDELTALWRSITAGRSVAVLIDGAVDVQQVRPLLPAGASTLTVVTSRSALRELAVDGAVFHPLRPLSQDSAIQLLADLAGQERIEAAPREAARLADRCFRLPLALVLAGAQLAIRRHHSVATITNALAPQGLPDTTYGEDPARMTIDTTLDNAYQGWDEETQRVYRQLGILPTGDIDPALTATVCAMEPQRAERALELLTDAQLLEPLPEMGGRVRYRILPAARHHAWKLAVRHDPEQDQILVLRRLCEWVLAIAAQAQIRLTSAQATLQQSMATGPVSVQAPFDDDTGALAWLESYQDSLLDLLHSAETAGFDELVARIVDAFWPLFLRHHTYEVWVPAHEIGLAAARRAGNQAMARQMLLSGAIGLNAAGRGDAAILWYTEALDDARAAGDLRDEGQALLGLGACHYEAGRHDQARASLSQAIALWESCGYPRGIALAKITLGEMDLAHAPGQALDTLTEAHALLLEAGDSHEVARVRVLRGRARFLTGDVEDGIREMTDGLTTLTEADSTRRQAHALELLGLAYQELGDTTTALDCYQQAVSLYVVMRPADAERVSALAAGL